MQDQIDDMFEEDPQEREDNDEDGQTDFPADRGCEDAEDNDETDDNKYLNQCTTLL